MEGSLKIEVFNRVLSVDLCPPLPRGRPFVGGKWENFKQTSRRAGAQSPDTLSTLGFSKLGFS